MPKAKITQPASSKEPPHIDKRTHKNPIAASSYSVTTAEEKPFRLRDLPDDLLGEGALSDALNLKELAALEIAFEAKKLYSLFKPQLTAPLLLQQVFQGKQEEVKAVLDKAKKVRDPDWLLSLLRAKNIVTDYSGKTFKEALLTPFQVAYVCKDRHMMDLLRGSKLSLLALGEEEVLPENVKEEARNNKMPILIRRGKDFFIYGYDRAREASSEEAKWQETPVRLAEDVDQFKEEYTLLGSLPFSSNVLEDSSHFLTPEEYELFEALPFNSLTLEDSGDFLTPALRELLKQGHPPLEQYLSEEEQAQQLLELRENKIKYSLPLVNLPGMLDIDGIDLLDAFRSLSIQNNNKPLLIKQREELRLYGYDFEKESWQLTTPAKPELFSNLPFSTSLLLNESRLWVLPDLEEEQLAELPPGLSLDFVLIQKQPGEKPEALYRVDRSQDPPKVREIIFPINQNLHTFLRALYPMAEDDVYVDLPELNAEQLQKLIQTTGYPVNVAGASLLTEEQYEELANYHTQGTEHGLHVDDRHLEEALRIYMANVDAWEADQQQEYWRKAVRSAQRLVAVHVANEYCRKDRSFASVPKYESEMHLPRELSFYNYVTLMRTSWFPLDSISGLDPQIAVCRGTLVLAAGGVGGGVGWRPTRDLAAVSRLCKVSTEYLVKLKESLPKLVPALAPPTP